MRCPSCGATVGADFAFCENCGATLTPSAASAPATKRDHSARTHLITLHAEPDTPPAPLCAECGGAVGDDGWCTVCGARASNGREHVAEQPAPAVAAVSDRGRVHARNEDAFAVAARDSWAALVVCDGVTTATNSDAAAYAAARAARDLLAAAERPNGSADERLRHWSLYAKAAVLAADEAAEAAGPRDDPSPPSCTFVAAIADGAAIVTANVGDSRAYWLPDDGPPEQLTVDDSWATEQIKAGVPRDKAEADPKAHAITRWLGIDSPGVDAATTTTIATGPGWLLACSDGLWNYCSDAAALRSLLDEQPTEPLARAEALVEWANQRGGHDNITVTLARIGDTY
jgi:serine/threonine protein phosphatase PrpC